MPTGLTYKIYDGDNMSLKDFALACAKHFVNCDGDDLPHDNPPVFEVPDYYKNEIIILLDELKKWLEALQHPQDFQKQLDDEYQKHMEENKAYEKQRTERKNRYLIMLNKTNSWNPPTDLLPLKEFMVKQLNESMDFDCSPCELYTTKKMTPLEWIQNKIEFTLDNLRFYTRNYKNKMEKTAETNAYLKNLYESLNDVD